MISPSASLISFRTALSRSSNSPRYFAPATMADRSREMSCLPLSESATSPATMRWAKPSTTAVLPTPGSPMRTGLFFVRLVNTWETRRISASRPMTGSSFPSRAISVRFTPYCARALSWLGDCCCSGIVSLLYFSSFLAGGGVQAKGFHTTI